MKFKKYFLLILMLFIASLNFNLFLKPLKLITGGTQGISIIFNHLFNLSPSFIILIINIIMLIISYITLSKETTYSAVISTLLYPLFIKLTSNIIVLNINTNYILFLVMLSGIICGITGGLIYKLGFSSGGINLIPLIIKKYFKINISITNFFMNTIIILLGCFNFGIIKTIYSILVIFINSYIINKFLRKNN